MKDFIFREQIENKGYYIKIRFEVELIDNKNSKLEMIYSADEKWKIFCETGILLFFEYFYKNETKSLKVNVYEIDWLPVDTNSILVLFSTVKALSDALDYKISALAFDTGKFIFPDSRLIVLS
jgi:hypothetical protein